MAGVFNERNTWIGIGAKFGGQMIGAGIESVTGYIMNLENPSLGAGFTIENVRLGPGLGGNLLGGTIVIVLDCRSILALDGTEIEDWGVNVAFGAKLDSLVRMLRAAKEFDALWPIARTMLKGVGHARSGMVQAGKAAAPTLAAMGVTAQEFDQVKTAVNYTWNAVNTYGRPGDKPYILTLDIPGTGYGLELSLVATQGKFSIL